VNVLKEGKKGKEKGIKSTVFPQSGKVVKKCFPLSADYPGRYGLKDHRCL
jgi:hypothetical protein